MNSFSTTVLCAGLLVLSLTNQGGASQRRLPNPILALKTTEYLDVRGTRQARYHFEVVNREAFPAELFAPAPKLPPCGTNSNSSRTWIDVYDSSGKRLNGFCALKTPAQLDDIWFSLNADDIPPSWIYIELNDRETNTKYKSNLAETTQ